jgi:hypothetical protein
MRNGGRNDVFGGEVEAVDEGEGHNVIYGDDAAVVGTWRDDIARAMWDQYQDHLNIEQ